MEFKAEHMELFDAYLQKKLSAEERLNFENRLSSDPGFAAEFEAFQLFEQDITDAEVTAFKDQLKQWDKSQEEKIVKKGRVITMKMIGLAASVAVILIVSILYFTSTPNHQELVAANFEPYDNILTVRGEKEDLDEGLIQYELGEYKTAISIFKAYPNNINAQFYLGEAELALNNYKNAIHVFDDVLKTDGIFNEIATYHLALAYIGNDEISQAKETLSNIKIDSDYYSIAQDLLAELE